MRQTSTMDFISKRPRLSEPTVVAPSGERLSDGQKMQEGDIPMCPRSALGLQTSSSLMEEEDSPVAMMVLRQSTPEYPSESNSMISSPRSGPSRPSTPTTSSPVTAPPPVQISSARASFRFFNSLLRTVYDSCVLPTETAFAAPHSICSSM